MSLTTFEKVGFVWSGWSNFWLNYNFGLQTHQKLYLKRYDDFITCVTCINFLTTSLPKMWSNTVCRNGSAIMDNFSLSRCHMSTRDSSMAIMDTWNTDGYSFHFRLLKSYCFSHVALRGWYRKKCTDTKKKIKVLTIRRYISHFIINYVADLTLQMTKFRTSLTQPQKYQKYEPICVHLVDYNRARGNKEAQLMDYYREADNNLPSANIFMRFSFV